MSKPENKIMVTVELDTATVSGFLDYCNANGCTVAELMEKIMREHSEKILQAGDNHLSVKDVA